MRSVLTACVASLGTTSGAHAMVAYFMGILGTTIILVSGAHAMVAYFMGMFLGMLLMAWNLMEGHNDNKQ